ncbi:MAG: FtsH protease activity modulator HflK [Polyangiales bacterium]
MDDLGAVGDFLSRIGRGLSGQLGVLLIVGVAIVSMVTSYYQVEPEEVALVTRFGRYVYTAQPGPHFKWPLGIETTHKVPIQRQLKEEFGFRTIRAGVQSDFRQGDDASKESSMLTGDLNVANVEWIIQYKVKDPYKFTFRVRDVQGTLRDVTEAMMRKVVGDHSVSEVLTVGRERIQVQVKDDLQEVCDHYEMGVEIMQLVLQDVNPPEAVRDSFNEVNQALQERERVINQAWASYNSVIPEAEGKALQTVQAAEGYATERVNNARGEVQRFVAIESEYKKAPAVTRARLFLENIDRVMVRAKRRMIIDDSLKGILPLFGTAPGGKP